MDERRSQSIGARIKKVREARGLTQEQVADRIGKSASSVRGYEKGEGQIWRHPELINALAEALGVTAAFLFGGLGQTWFEGEGPRFRSVEALPQAQIRRLGYIGGGTESSQDPLDALGVLYVPLEFAGEDHTGFELEGNSMLPYLHPGDTLIFKMNYQPRIGRINAAILKEDGGPVAKQVEIRDGNLVLASFQDDYAPIPPEDVKFLGYLIGIDGESLRIGPIWDGIGRDYLDRELRSRLP